MFNTPQTVPKSHKVSLKWANLKEINKANTLLQLWYFGSITGAVLEKCNSVMWSSLQTAIDLSTAELMQS